MIFYLIAAGGISRSGMVGGSASGTTTASAYD